MRKQKTVGLIVLMLCALSQTLYAHCEIPCGIYGDKTRIEILSEHIDTIEKSMDMIERLSQAESANYNQLVRWITNKEAHAEKFQNIVSRYFITQRIGPEQADTKNYQKYITQITLLHKMMVSAMKAKQTTDTQHITALRSLLKQFSDSYFSAEERKQIHIH